MVRLPPRDIHRAALRGYRARQRDVLLNSGSGWPWREQGAWMNNSELAERLAGRTGMSKAAAKVAVDGVFEAIGDALANGDEARILSFGTFGTRNRPARTARNPRTGETLSIAASTVPVLRRARRSRMPWAAEHHEWGPNPARGTSEASEGQQVEITRFRYDDRRRHPFLRADCRIEAWPGIAAVGPAAVSGLRQNRQKRVRRTSWQSVYARDQRAQIYLPSKNHTYEARDSRIPIRSLLLPPLPERTHRKHRR